VLLISIGPLLAAFIITLIEMAEVVALVFAFSADHVSVRSSALGAVAGSTVVGAVAAAFGAVLITLPTSLLLYAAAVVLVAFGLFLLRSTLRSYRKLHQPPPAPGTASAPAKASAHAAQFAGGFSIGVVEMVETVIVLIALAAAGFWFSAVVGAAAAIVVLVGVAAVLHDRVRRIKTPQLKLIGTALLFTFAVFWGGDAAGVSWPGADLFLIPLFVVFFVVIRQAVHWRTIPRVQLQTNR
jgi:Ca2+/H+ antiporter, TMEM165/GDT1 family